MREMVCVMAQECVMGCVCGPVCVCVCAGDLNVRVKVVSLCEGLWV